MNSFRYLVRLGSLVAAALCNFHEPGFAQKIEDRDVRLKEGERLQPLNFTVRSNYVLPQQVSVEEGIYEIVINNPNGVASQRQANLNDERGSAIAQLQTSDKSPRSRMFVKLMPGKHVLRLDNQERWTVNIEVRAKQGK